MRQLRSVGAGLIASIIASIPVVAVSQSSTRSPRIINGSPLSTSNTAIVEVRGKTSRGNFICTGSIISPTAILTAAHCATTAKNMSVVIAGRSFGVTKVKVHPALRFASSGLAYNDVSILFLSKPTSKPRLALLVSRGVASGDLLSIFGFGLDQFGNVGILRGGSIPINTVSQNFISTFFDSLSESNTCNGDSGGPAVVSYSDDSGATHTGLVGTVSTGTRANCLFGDRTYFINVQSSPVRNFILHYVPTAQLS